MAILNSNPEILLRKRKNADRKRLEKQDQIRERQILKKTLKKKKNTNKFIRPETLISNHKSNELERKRIKNLIKQQHRDTAEPKEDVADEYKLLFVIRIPNHTKGLKIPTKASQILQVLRLTKVNTGVFIRSSAKTENILKLIEPYVLVGSPSLNSVRKLFQQRATIKITEESAGEEGDEPVEKVVRLDDNLLVEKKFGDDLGLCCVEDLVAEITSNSDNFIKITSWLEPFALNAPINGWGPEAKLARMSNQEFKIEDYL
ncbi:Ribosome biogenesis protein RLP7 [Candida viswanathii]|uniref:Ribosome biogenesis protein RLP7 n=1 Tax=Candida viswanathii TaxID=5486 RepID=A0A367Y8S8_9ASCO|nr:Ribosome biogenesis protein RLP7 [Candida viswanathii]